MGAIQENRCGGIPLTSKKEMEKKAANEDSCSACDDCLLVDRWKDNKVVTVVSNCIPKNEHGSIKRYNRKEHKVVTVPVPKSIETCNAIMWYVDLMNQNIACYRSTIKSKKWWWPFFSWMLRVFTTNAWVLWRKAGHKDSQLMFMRAIVQHGLAKHGQPRSRVGRPSRNLASVEKTLRYEGMNHWPTKIGGSLRCAACGGRTCYRCSKCDKALHPDCFMGYHVG